MLVLRAGTRDDRYGKRERGVIRPINSRGGVAVFHPHVRARACKCTMARSAQQSSARQLRCRVTMRVAPGTIVAGLTLACARSTQGHEDAESVSGVLKLASGTK